MQIQISMGPNFGDTIRSLGGMGTAVLEACSAGLARGCKLAAGNVSENYLSGQQLNRRTGDLARAVDGWLLKPLEGAVGVREDAAVAKYAWLLTDEERTITPKKGSALTIPIGEALTGRGVPKFESVRNAEIELGVKIFRLPGKNVLGYVRGKKGKFRPLFALVKSVFVQGSGALADGVLESVDDITESMQSEVDRETGQ